MIIDSHIHLGLNSFCKQDSKRLEYDLQNNIDDLLSFMNCHNIDKSVVLPIPGNDYDSSKSNDYLCQASNKYHDRFYPFCKLDNNLSINLICNNFYGAKFHMVYEKFSNKVLEKYYKELEYYGFPLMIHAKFADKISQIYNILSIAPKLKIIVAHLGRGHIYTDEMVEEILTEFRDNQNVYFETSTVGRISAIENACNIIGSNRIIFGSDYPFGKAWFKDGYVYGDELSLILNAKISKEDKDNILYKTMLSLMDKCDKSRKKVLIRPVVKEDKEQLFSKIATISDYDKKLLALDKKMQLIKENIRKCRHVFIATCENEIVGFFRESGRLDNSNMLEEIVVFDGFRGKGYSKKIMDYYTKFFPKSFAKTHSNNIKINKLLSEYGFVGDNGLKIMNWSRSI